jgi:hypothetical protein
MGYYEPRWSAEEQTMIDVMKLNNWMVGADIEKECTSVAIFHTDKGHFVFKADTEYEAIRKAFNYWNKHNA